MWKLRRTKTRILGRNDNKEQHHRPLYKVIFSLAMSLGIKPKKLVKFMDSDKVKKFAIDLSQEIKNEEKKVEKKLIDKLNKK